MILKIIKIFMFKIVCLFNFKICSKRVTDSFTFITLLRFVKDRYISINSEYKLLIRCIQDFFFFFSLRVFAILHDYKYT